MGFASLLSQRKLRELRTWATQMICRATAVAVGDFESNGVGEGTNISLDNGSLNYRRSDIEDLLEG